MTTTKYACGRCARTGRLEGAMALIVDSEATAKRHLANIYPKMGVGSRGEAMRKALDNEWLTIHEITADADNG